MHMLIPYPGETDPEPRLCPHSADNAAMAASRSALATTEAADTIGKSLSAPVRATTCKVSVRSSHDHVAALIRDYSYMYHHHNNSA